MWGALQQNIVLHGVCGSAPAYAYRARVHRTIMSIPPACVHCTCMYIPHIHVCASNAYSTASVYMHVCTSPVGIMCVDADRMHT